MAKKISNGKTNDHAANGNGTGLLSVNVTGMGDAAVARAYMLTAAEVLGRVKSVGGIVRVVRLVDHRPVPDKRLVEVVVSANSDEVPPSLARVLESLKKTGVIRDFSPAAGIAGTGTVMADPAIGQAQLKTNRSTAILGRYVTLKVDENWVRARAEADAIDGLRSFVGGQLGNVVEVAGPEVLVSGVRSAGRLSRYGSVHPVGAR